MIRFDASGWEGLDGMGEEILREMKPKAEALMWQAGTRFQAALKMQLTGTRSGRTYRVSKTGKLHRASAPGESPAVLFGNLRNSMGFSRPKWSGFTVEMEAGTGLGVGADGEETPTYARRLEFGGFGPLGVYIAPRPYMAPVVLRMEPELERLFEGGL